MKSCCPEQAACLSPPQTFRLGFTHRAALPPLHCTSLDLATALQRQRRVRTALAGHRQVYLFLAQTVKQGFFLHPKANVDEGTVFPRAEGSQAGREAVKTLVRETKGDKIEASFSSSTQQ